MADFNNDYASKGVGNAGLTLGIIGSALGALNGGILGGNGLGGILGGGNNIGAVNAMNNARRDDDKIDYLSTELAREKSERYTDQKVCELKSLMYDKFEGVNSTLCAQSTWNATNTATISCLTDKLNNLMSLVTYGIASDKVISSSSTTTTT